MICVPSHDDGSLDAPVSQHFGRAPNFTIYDTETDSVDVIENHGQHHGGGRSPPAIIAETGADVLLCGNLGRKAVDRFDAMDIDVYCDADGTVAEAIEQFEAGALEMATPDGSHCEGHDGDGHGHSHDHDGDGRGDSHDHGHAHEPGPDH